MNREITAYDVRKIVLDQSKKAGVGHIGSSLSIVEILVTLFRDVLNIPDIQAPDRDRFILSKGHAALALYAILNLKGILSADQLDQFCQNGGKVGVHPEHALEGIDFATGSLGHGLSIGAGAAYAARLQNAGRRVFVLISDAECNEGSIWEAVMFSAHHKLSNLIVLVDLNGQQALGYTNEVCDLSPLEEKWRVFGWDVHIVDGHDEAEIANTIAGLDTQSGPPHVLIARTTFGRGVSYMENKIKWHYWPMSDAEYRQALDEIGGRQ